jgi:hypothetical protein
VSKAPPPKPVKLSVVSSNVELMVADWLAKNGGPRRIERGVSRDWIEGLLRKPLTSGSASCALAGAS